MGNDGDSNKKENSTNDEYEDLSSIEEHELEYKRRLQRMEFTDGSSQEELLEKANSFQPSPYHRLEPDRANKLINPIEVKFVMKDVMVNPKQFFKRVRRSACFLHS